MNYLDRIKRGKEIMANSSCLIGGVARNVEFRIRQIIPYIEELSNQFSRCSIFILENDSDDNTKDVLLDWIRSNKKVSVRFCTFGLPMLTGFNIERIQNMCKYRNHLLCELQYQYPEFEYLIMLDLDLSGFSLQGVANTFGWENWDCVGSNGRKYLSMSRCSNIYYDTFSHREIGDPAFQNINIDTINDIKRSRLAYLQEKYRTLNIGNSLVQVWSCFGGLAVYRAISLIGCKYEALQGYAEHVGLHSQMIRLGHNQIFINPSQVVYYDDVMRDEWKKREEKIQHDIHIINSR